MSELEKTIAELMEQFSEEYSRILEVEEKAQEDFWNSLSKEDQLKCFCAVSRRILKGEISDRGSYRYVLYDIFGFGPEAYGQAQDAGYLAIHNAIMTEEYDKNLLDHFCEVFEIETTKIKQFMEMNNENLDR